MASIAVTGVGALTPVGLSAASSAAALRAGVARIGEIASTIVPGPSGTSVSAQGGRVPLEWFEGGPREEEWPGHELFGVPPPIPEHLLVEDGAGRLARLAGAAALQCWARSGGEGAPPATWGLFLGIGEHEGESGARSIVDAVREALGGFQPAILDVKAEGRGAPLLAAQRAFTAIEAGTIDGAFVGGVDSLVRPAAFDRLREAGVLRDPGVNPQGILPGEASAFFLLERRPRANAAALAKYYGGAAAVERTAGTDQPTTGQGLTAALRAAREAAPLRSMPLVVCDLNGDRLRALEWAMAQTRVFGDLPWRDELPTSGDVWHPADCIGDAGAGLGAVDCIWAVEAIAAGYAMTERVVVWGASDGQLRAAAVFGPGE